MTDDLKQVQQQVEDNSSKYHKIVDDIVSPYTKELDDYMSYVKKLITDYDNPPTNLELDDFIMNLSVLIYYASSMQEALGIKDDIAKAVYKEAYHGARDVIDKGTVADKDSQAELASQRELIVSMLYKRAYSIVKVKVSAAQEMLASIKKVVSRRITEMELTRIGG